MSMNTNSKEVVDPNHSKRKYLKWNRKKDFESIAKEDSNLIKLYLQNMEDGINVAKGRRGSRSYARLNALRSRIPLVAKWIKQNYSKRLTNVTAAEITQLFSNLTKGKIRKVNGEPYKSYDDYAKDFKAFWNWYIRYMRREHNEMIEDITFDLDSNNNEKPKFNYFDFNGFKKLMNEAKTDYQDLILFMYDSGVRSPSELMNIKVSDLTPIENSDKLYLNVRDEVSKTFGRKFKLMLSSQRIKERIERLKLKKNEFLFKCNPIMVNRYLKRLGYRVLGIGKKVKRIEKLNGKKVTRYDIKEGLTMYDFRHNSVCYWLPRYKSQSALIYKFAWKSHKMIEYYSEFLGMKDTITEDDLLDDVSKTELQQELERYKQRLDLIEEKNAETEKTLYELKEQQSLIKAKN